MKRITLVVAVLTLVFHPGFTQAAITIDGLADTAYGSAVATQALGTTAFDNNISTNIGLANGSELDAAYGFVSNGVLYLTIAGNFDTQSGAVPYDTLHAFFMTDDGAGGDHVLGAYYNGTFNGRINNLVGMTFDPGFTANYWIGVNSGQDSTTNPVSMYVDYVVICSNCPSAYLGSVNPPDSQPAAVLTNVYFGNVMQFALDNSNTGGVTATACTTNENGVLQSVAASTVRSGIEMAIPLATIGNPTGTVRVCAFITDQTMMSLYNQALGAFDGGVPYCQDYGGNFTTSASYFDFGSWPGQHYFTFSVPPCDVIKVGTASASFTKTGGVASVSVANAGGCPISVTSDSAWLSIVSTTGLGSGNGSFTYQVATNNTIYVRVGNFIITDTEGSGNIVTQTVSITQQGIAAPPLGIITVDGTAESAYGCPISVQQIPTQFGNSTSGNISNAVGGSELDAAYGYVQNNVLFLVFAGNIEGNGNKFDVFLQTGPGGMNTMTNLYNPNQSSINNMNGLKFGPGFAPNHVFIINDYAGTLYSDYVQLWPGGTNATGQATNGYYLGYSTPTNGTLQAGNNPYGIQIAVNESNTNGVGGTGTCNTDAVGSDPGSVRTGVELAIPLAAIGSPTGAIAVCAFVNGGGNDYLSNQLLPPIGTNDPAVTVCQGNLGSPSTVNLTNQVAPYFLVGPEMRITGINRSSANINVSYLTEANTNLSYQVQRAGSVTNGATWSSVGGLNLGSGGIITVTDTGGATNAVRFYRVRETPLCP